MADHFYVMPLETVIEGTVGVQGGTLYDAWDEMSLIIAPGTVQAETVFRVMRGLGEDGDTYSLQTEPDNIELAFAPSLTLAGSSNREATLQETQLQTKADGGWSEWTGPTYATFLEFRMDLNLYALNRIPAGKDASLNILQHLVVKYRKETASALYSLCGNSDSFPTSTCAGRTPVLFVHGFERDSTNFGGGKDTWGDFPELLHAAGYAVFEFRYKSAARFEDIAGDLGVAITQIQQATNDKVHVIAHSFGGVVARTYIQDYGTVPYNDNIASLVTLGTPHSGIFGSPGTRHDIFFPKGTDTTFPGISGGLFINSGFVTQLSVHEAGGNIGDYIDKLDFRGLSIEKFFGVSVKPGESIANLADTMSSYPSTVPTLALIGLKANGSTYTNGDGLISYAGQRFDPGLSVRNNAESPVLLSDRHMDSASGNQLAPTIYEKILYFPQYALPGQTVPGAYAGHSGYGHIGLLGGTFPEAFVAAANAAPSTVAQPTPEAGKKYHHGYLEVRNWLAAHATASVPSSLVSVRVHVLDAATSLGIEGVSVQAFVADTPIGPLGQTNDNGYATLDVPFISNSVYAITFLANGYKTLSKERAIVTQSTNAGTVIELGDSFMQPQLPGRGSLVGAVVDRTAGTALADAQCTLSNGVRTFNTYSAADGRYQIEDISAGTWSLIVSLNGYRNAEQAVVIRSGEMAEAVVKMTLQTQTISAPTVKNYDPDYYGWVGNTSAYMFGRILNDGGDDISGAFIGYGREYDGSDWKWHKVMDPYNDYQIMISKLEYGVTYYCQTAANNLSLPSTWGYGTKYSFNTDSTRNMADLVPRISRFTPSGVLFAGSTYRLSKSIVNLGDIKADASCARSYLSTDNDWDVSGDYYLGEFAVNALGPGEETWIQHDFVMPALKTGTYDLWLVTVVDVYEAIPELRESNTYKTMSDEPFRASENPASKVNPIAESKTNARCFEICPLAR
jgi:pimeloyl-ACP methyl ester carboxylesterase